MRYFRRFREAARAGVAAEGARSATEADAPALAGTVEVDEAYFGGDPRKDNWGGHAPRKRGRGAPGKVKLVGIVERGPERRAVVEIVDDVKAATLTRVIEDNVAPGTDIMTDSWRGYARLEDRGWDHFPVNHSAGEFREAYTGAHTNTIETFWRQLKRHFSRFNGGWRARVRDWVGEGLARWKWRKAGDLMDAVRRGLRMG